MDQLDVASGRFSQECEIVNVDRHNLIAVSREQHDTSIDDVCKPGSAKEPPRSPTKRLIERADIDSAERLRQTSLTWAAAPHLSEHPGVGHREVSIKLGGLQTDPHRAFVALQRDQGAAVENEAHAVFALRVDC